MATISPKLLTEVHDFSHYKQIWEFLPRRFNTASLARAMDLRHILSNLSKDPKHNMEDYLRGIKHIADSLASIQTVVPDIILGQLTLNGLDEGYHNLVTTLPMAPIYSPLMILVPNSFIMSSAYSF